ncbi:MAG: NAD-dependent epimerase/dehydratase family protein [Candidatus Promineifilaceae bacterium]
MRILILGGDGYLGWPTVMHFAAKGHDVAVIDNYSRRLMAQQTQSEALMPNPNLHDRASIFHSLSDYEIQVHIGNVADYRTLEQVFEQFQPEAVVHYAEQPSAPYSMMGFREASYTLNNNLNATLNLIFAVMEHAPDCHIIKLGTMGEYGTPNIDIEEGWLEVEHKGRKQKFLYPRQTGSLYHTTKIMDTDLLWFYVRTFGLAVTDLMQGPVYGLFTSESEQDERLLPNFHYDDIFGTLVNRFLVQAVANVPLTIYGKGGQIRGYLNLNDTLQCIELAATKPASKGELRILNQFTETFSVNDLAKRVQSVGKQLGLDVKAAHIDNPRKEPEEHYYNPAHSGLLELGLQPHYLTDEVLAELLQQVMRYKDRIDTRKIMPRVRWK